MLQSSAPEYTDAAPCHPHAAPCQSNKFLPTCIPTYVSSWEGWDSICCECGVQHRAWWLVSVVVLGAPAACGCDGRHLCALVSAARPFDALHAWQRFRHVTYCSSQGNAILVCCTAALVVLGLHKRKQHAAHGANRCLNTTLGVQHQQAVELHARFTCCLLSHQQKWGTLGLIM
jgi:hypothetical protein